MPEAFHPSGSLVSFYSGTSTDHRGRTIEALQNLSLEQLESSHDVIQWLFWLSEKSRFNTLALTLEAHPEESLLVGFTGTRGGLSAVPGEARILRPLSNRQKLSLLAESTPFDPEWDDTAEIPAAQAEPTFARGSRDREVQFQEFEFLRNPRPQASRLSAKNSYREKDCAPPTDACRALWGWCHWTPGSGSGSLRCGVSWAARPSW